jgi:hypothetical protein
MDDCAICVVAMVMGYSYERVFQDSLRYEKQLSNGKFFEWWVPYIQHQGRRVEFRPFEEAFGLCEKQRYAVGILGMTLPLLKRRHVVALDIAGVIDPADGCPDHMPLVNYIAFRLPYGVVFDDHEFLVIQS